MAPTAETCRRRVRSRSRESGRAPGRDDDAEFKQIGSDHFSTSLGHPDLMSWHVWKLFQEPATQKKVGRRRAEKDRQQLSVRDGRRLEERLVARHVKRLRVVRRRGGSDQPNLPGSFVNHF